MTEPENSEDAIALWTAAEKGDINEVRKLLERGVNPNHVKEYSSTILEAMSKKHMEIVKLLVQYDADLYEYHFFYDIFGLESILDSKELIAHIVKYNKNIYVLQNISMFLITKCTDRVVESTRTQAEILQILLDNGLPVNEHLREWLFDDDDQFTPLHLSTRHKRMDFVTLLLDRGADINKKTGAGMSCLYVAANEGNALMIEPFVKKGAKVNEILSGGITALHRACKKDERDVIYILCKHGADVNILDVHGRPPSAYFESDAYEKEVLIEEFAKLKFENHYLCSENLQFIQSDEYLQKTFDDCLEELRKMKDSKFYNGFSFYNILKMRNQCKKLIFLMKNNDFVEAYKSNWNNDSFEHYAYDVNEIFKECLEKKNILVTEEEKLDLIFKDFLPKLVLSRTAYFVHEYLIFD